MEKNEFLKFCRYFRGEAENPFEGKDQDKAMLWFYERGWVADMLRVIDAPSYRLFNAPGYDPYEEMAYDYGAVGLAEFREGDGVPFSLKVLLFNRFAKYAYSQALAVEPFKAFYEKYY
ncbi:MAG: hypothetical protein HUK14_10885 [Muribaculaceae bacterium]|nr:hypothetical protein [Muribaculaceae bacterium]MCF0220275.1 hypothetical protein [Muribaculaceae bacterium]